jgi:hypothetical protein
MDEMRELSIAEQVDLIARVGSRAGSPSVRLRYGVLAGMVLDLEGAGRLRVHDGGVTVLDPSRTGDALQDAVLEQFLDTDRDGRLTDVLGRLDRRLPRLETALTHRLEHRGLIERREVRVLGVIRSSEYQPVGSAYEAIRRRLRRAALDRGSAEPTAAAVVGLLSACRLLPKILDRRERRSSAERIGALTRETEAYAVSEAARAVESSAAAAAIGGIVASSAAQG